MQPLLERGVVHAVALSWRREWSFHFTTLFNLGGGVEAFHGMVTRDGGSEAEGWGGNGVASETATTALQPQKPQALSCSLSSSLGFRVLGSASLSSSMGGTKP